MDRRVLIPLFHFVVAVLLAFARVFPASAQIVINEIVADPQQDWNDSIGGNGIPFDREVGGGAINDNDEWVELLNVSDSTVDLSAWLLVMTDSAPSTEILGVGAANIQPSSGTTLSAVRPGGRLVIGNPVGSISDNCHLILRNATGTMIDSVEIGSGNFAGDGAANNAPGGNAAGVDDEAVARVPDGTSGVPSSVFRHAPATIGTANPGLPPLVLINEVVSDPLFDWSNNIGGNGVAFDDIPGTGLISDVDEWIELVNVSGSVLSLVGWRILMRDTSPATETLGSGSAVLRFEFGGTLSGFGSGEHLVVGNPSGSINNEIWIQLIDSAGRLVDEVEFGNDDYKGNGVGDEGPNGNATSAANEALARLPEAADTNNDKNDFVKQASTIGRSNAASPPPPATRSSRWSLYK